MKDLSEAGGITWLHLEGIPTLFRYPEKQREPLERGASRQRRWWAGENGKYPCETAL